MELVSFNVNGLRSRLHQLEELINTREPDIIGLQETKVDDAQFPRDAIEKLGYQVDYFGQKGHYGVALLSNPKTVSVLEKQLRKGFPGDTDDDQKRLIANSYEINGSIIHVINGYFPQGEGRDHPVKFPAKRKYYEDLLNFLNDSFTPNDNVVVMGDFNISPTDLDIGIGEENRKRWLRSGKCSFLPEEREWLSKLENWGLTDSYRHLNPESQAFYSWFDYRSKGFEREPRRGLRIDLIMTTSPLLTRCTDCAIDYHIRGMEKPSDHCPVSAVFE
ncbi:exonuclease III [Oleiphilus messinensis]|uniref:Exonuclease III n=1 Tax=Oleiphilus messinensis TaxID=141451 RepID=A0A1Y0I900_9GAMM|nr:exodeoxyribonuclease III [Oleiphilus messinensis]ARU56941.1 exonuclease III [Oleiphilus messinensis]